MSEQLAIQEEIRIPSPASPAKTGGARFLDELLWLAMGFILPAGSFTFYKKAARRSAGWAFLFFVLFCSALAVISSLAFNRQVDTAVTDIEKELTKMVFPAITVRNGVATAKGPQPYTIYGSQGEIFAIDTTGKLNSLDTSRYTTGILVTRDGIQVLNAQQGRNQFLPWADLQRSFKIDPLVIDKNTILTWIATILGFVKAAALGGIWLWEVLGRMTILLVIALILWGIGALVKPGTGFGHVLVVGIYTYVPAVYLNFIINQAGAKFPFKLSLGHTLLWAVILLFTLDVFGKRGLSRERPIRTWRVLIGVPALILMPMQAVQGWESGVAWSVIAWGAMEIALLVIGIQGVLAQPLEEPVPGN
jgi:hypothetical protein